MLFCKYDRSFLYFRHITFLKYCWRIMIWNECWKEKLLFIWFFKFHILLRRLNGQITHQICRKLLDILLLAINHSSVKKKLKYFSFEIWTSLYMYTALYQKEKHIALNDCEHPARLTWIKCFLLLLLLISS